MKLSFRITCHIFVNKLVIIVYSDYYADQINMKDSSQSIAFIIYPSKKMTSNTLE